MWLRARGTRVILGLQNAPDGGRFYRAIWRWLIDPVADVYVCNSAFTERELLAHDLDAGKVRVIPNVATPRRTAWRTDQTRVPGRIIYVGQIIPDKGVDRLIEAVALMRARGYGATLDVVGEMDGWEAAGNRGYHAQLRARAAQHDLTEAVRFLGWREDVPEVMARASVHCCPSLPSIREAFGLVVLEAKLAGLPSVVTPSGYLPELVTHGESGWVCSAATPEAIAEGLAFFLTDPVRLRAAGLAARESASAFSPERYTSDWAQVFA
jgi:glycosyltransferase involved in cell wall biosynthesis